LLETLWKDVRFGLRTLVRHPATTAVALATLALGIGANTAIFSVVSGVLLEPLPYPQPDRLVVLWESNREAPRFPVSTPDLFDWRDQGRAVLSQLVVVRPVPMNLTGGDQPEVVRGGRVSADFFRLFGVKMQLGRDFRPEEDRPGGERVAVLSDGLWRRRFGSDRGVLGKRLLLDGQSYLVVGVAKRDFAFPAQRELWVPVALDISRENRGLYYVMAAGRLRPGVGIDRARSELATIATRLARQYPDTNAGSTVEVVRLQDLAVENIRPALLILLVAVGCVLVIACANVANLLLARVAAREREVAVRAALGAGRGRLVRQLLTESAVLFLGGGLLGLLLAFWATPALVALDADGIPRAGAIHLDARVLLFTLAVSLATGLLFGLVPAFSAVGGRLYEALKEGGRAMAGGVRGRLVRGGLVLVEVAIALVLLVGAGLLLKSFARLRAVDPGFRAKGVLTMTITLPPSKYTEPAQQIVFYRQLLERVAALPGAERAALVFPLPFDNPLRMNFTLEGRPRLPRNQAPEAAVGAVSADYFDVLGVPLLRGRRFNAGDQPGSVPVAIVSRATAAKMWPGQNPIGKRLSFDAELAPESWKTVVGVVGDVHQYSLGEQPGLQVYWPQLQDPWKATSLVLRTAGDPGALANAARAAVRTVDRDLPVDKVRTLDDIVDASLGQGRFQAVLLALFAGLALVLAAIGVYGVISYSVAQRTHEIGIRMALGARREEVLRLVVRQGMQLVLAGVAVGLVAAFLLARLFAGRVYGVAATDPLTFAAVPLVLLAVALLANLLPARRATQVDPLEALRYE
jgi:putative ABC transport system permease protein